MGKNRDLILGLAIVAGIWYFFLRDRGIASGNLTLQSLQDLLAQDNPASQGARDFYSAGGHGTLTTFYGTNVPIVVI